MKPNTVGRISGNAPADAPDYISGLQVDSLIMTLEGERPVSDLSPGDRVITRDSGAAHVKSVKSARVAAEAVRILAGSLGHTRPERDVILPAGQPLLVRDWRAEALFHTAQAMVPVHRLIDGEFITHAGRVEMILYELGFDAPHVLYVDGLELASDPAAPLSKAA